MSRDIISTWNQYCSEMSSQVSSAVFNTWILSNPITDIVEFDATISITITCPTAFHATNLQKNLHIQIKTALEKLLEKPCVLIYEVGDPQVHKKEVTEARTQPEQVGQLDPFAQFSQKESQSPRVEELFSQHTIQSAQEERYLLQARTVGLRPDFSFATFAVSTTNEMAHAAATAVSNKPGLSYNPLFLYGGVGVGKTHLMHAIANNILRANPMTKIIYCTGEEFTNDIVHAIQTKKATSFKDKFRSTNVLLIDDIQFIAGKNAVQEEFFHTFNALIKQQSQIVLTSDRPPHEITLLEDRLRSRFEAGLMIDIQQPSFELRTAIVLVKAKAQQVNMTIDLAKIIAAKVESARKIEGVITSIRSAIELQHKTLDADLLEDLLQTEVETRRSRIKVAPADVIKTVANHYHVKQISIKGTSRVKNLVTARHIAMYLLKKELSLPLVEIGRWFTSRDHTSVLHAVKKIEKDLLLDEQLQQDISALQTTLTAISK